MHWKRKNINLARFCVFAKMEGGTHVVKFFSIFCVIDEVDRPVEQGMCGVMKRAFNLSIR